MSNKIIDVCIKNNLRFNFFVTDFAHEQYVSGVFRFTRIDKDLTWAFSIAILEDEWFERELEFRIEEMLKNLCPESEVN